MLITYADDARNAPSQTPPDKTQRRVRALRDEHRWRGPFRILATFEDAKGRGAVAYTQTHTGRTGTSTKVAFFEGGGIKRPFAEKDYSASAHAVLGLEQAFHQAMAELKDRKQAPHPYKVGDIMVDIWGYSMRGAKFYQIVSLPTPRSFEAVAITYHYSKGDWMAGEVMPNVPDEGILASGPRERFEVSMAKGEPRIVRTSSISNFGLWNGKPVSVNSD